MDETDSTKLPCNSSDQIPSVENLTLEAQGYEKNASHLYVTRVAVTQKSPPKPPGTALSVVKSFKKTAERKDMTTDDFSETAINRSIENSVSCGIHETADNNTIATKEYESAANQAITKKEYETATNQNIATKEHETAAIQSTSKTTNESQDIARETPDESFFIKSSYRYVTAIDLGTTYSGYAYSSFKQFNRDPLDIVTPRWIAGNHLSLKTATCALYTPDGKFDSFGFEAENKYYDMCVNDPIDATSWRIFKHFKMELYKQEVVLESLILDDDQGRSMLALTVFSDCITYLKNKAMEDIRHVESDVIERDCRWILTVPAIWNDDARKFMINCAVQAGIHADDLLLSLEPEAAGVLCKEIQVQLYYKKKSNDLLAFNLGSKFVVVDLGGGTVEITTNEVLKNGRIKELHSATGGGCGGTIVDQYFEDFLRKALDVEDMEQFETENRCDFIDLYRAFEIKKRQFDSRMTEHVLLQIPPLISN